MTAATGNELTGAESAADEQEAGRHDDGLVNGIAAKSEDISLLVCSAGRVDWHGWLGRLALRAGSAGTGMTGRVSGHCGPG